MWNFNEGSGQTTYDDTIGGTNDLTLGSTSNPDNNDPTWTSTIEPNEYALGFAGSTDASMASYLYIEDSGAGSRDALDVETITIEAWVNLSTGALGGGDRVILAKPGAYGLWIDNNGYLNAYLSIEPYDDWLIATTQSGGGGVKIPEGRWSFVAMTYDKSSFKLYIDGVDRTGQSMPGGNNSIINSHLHLRIGVGQNFPTMPDNFKGLIDKIAVYNYSKSSTDIKNDYFGI